MPNPRIFGFSLIEVMIAMLVLALGVVGAASMQLTALKVARQSSFQTTALYLALQIADSIRAHAHHPEHGKTAEPYLAIDYRSADDQVVLTDENIHCYGKEAHCSVDQLTRFEIALWLRHLRKELPGVRVRVCRDAQPWDAGSEQYTWNCTQGNAAHTNVAVVIKIGWPVTSLWQWSASEPVLDFPPILVLPVAAYAQ